METALPTASQTAEQRWPFPVPPMREAPAETAPPPLLGAASDEMSWEADQRYQRIAAEAYKIAEGHGFPAGADLDHWLEAERRLGYVVKGSLDSKAEVDPAGA